MWFTRNAMVSVNLIRLSTTVIAFNDTNPMQTLRVCFMCIWRRWNGIDFCCEWNNNCFFRAGNNSFVRSNLIALSFSKICIELVGLWVSYTLDVGRQLSQCTCTSVRCTHILAICLHWFGIFTSDLAFSMRHLMFGVDWKSVFIIIYYKSKLNERKCSK